MKKHLKRLAVTVTVLFALLGATGTVAFASGYITWNGTQDYKQTLFNLNLISERGQELKTSNGKLTKSNEELTTSNEELKTNNENIIRELKQKHHNQLLDKDNQLLDKDNQLLDKDNKIGSLNQQIEALEKRVEGGKTTQDQLGQAEKDMKHVNQKSQEVLDVFNQGDTE